MDSLLYLSPKNSWGLFIGYQKFLYFDKRWILIFFLFAACSVKKPEIPVNTLRISFATFPNTFDPRKCSDFVSSTLVCMCYDGLTRCKNGGGVTNALAERTDISADCRVYTFHLRRASWSNGEPITAFDFERSWKQIIAQKEGCSFLFYPIEGVEEYMRRGGPIENVGIRALDPLKLEVTLKEPAPYFYQLTAFPSFMPAPPSEYGDVYSGPFEIHSSAPHEILLQKNRSHWNVEGVALDQIHISIIPDETTALALFQNQELDWLGGPLCPLPSDVDLETEKKMFYVPNAASTLLVFNTKTKPFENLALRKSFSYAIDRGNIVEKVIQNGKLPATTILPPNFSSNHFDFYDPSLAKKLFDQGLQEIGMDIEDLCLTLYFRPTPVEKRLAQTLQKEWERILGVHVRLSLLDYKSHTAKLHTKDFQIAICSWIAQYDDPLSILERFKDPTSLKNYSGWEDANYLALLEDSAHSDQRDLFLKKAEERLFDQMPLCPIFHWSSSALMSERVEEMIATPCGGILFEQFKIRSDRSSQRAQPPESSRSRH